MATLEIELQVGISTNSLGELFPPLPALVREIGPH